jgi:uncharacterized small protein (DUF1192 family)
MMDVSQIPAPVDSWSAWWPAFLQAFNVLCLVAGALWTAWLTFRTKRIDNEQKASDRSFDIEHERIKAEFERQKDFQDDLITECKSLRDECKLLREENHKLQEALVLRSATIAERDQTIAIMQRDIDRMKAEIDALKRHIQSLEDRGQRQS